MDNFYDINNFFAFLYRKKKQFIVLVLLVAIVFAGMRFVKNWNTYRAQAATVTQTETQQTESKTGEPIWTYVMYPVTAPATSEGETAISQFYAAAYDETVLNQIYDTWYEKELEEDASRKERLNQYGYILDKEKNYPYTRYDFFQQFLANGTDLTSLLNRNPAFNNNCNMIWLGFRSTDENLAREIAKDYIDAAMKKASQNGVSGVEIQNPSINYQLPAASAGAGPNRASGQGSNAPVMTKAGVLKQTIKGGIWGFLFGILLSILLLFFSFMMTQKMCLVRDFEKAGVAILGFTFLKKGKHRVRSRAYQSLEGYRWDPADNRHRIFAKVRNSMEEMGVSGGQVLVYGTCSNQVIGSVAEALNQEQGQDLFVPCEDISAANGKPVVIIERMSESLKKEVSGEIRELNEAHARILGIVGVE